MLAEKPVIFQYLAAKETSNGVLSSLLFRQSFRPSWKEIFSKIKYLRRLQFLFNSYAHFRLLPAHLRTCPNVINIIAVPSRIFHRHDPLKAQARIHTSLAHLSTKAPTHTYTHTHARAMHRIVTNVANKNIHNSLFQQTKHSSTSCRDPAYAQRWSF